VQDKEAAAKRQREMAAIGAQREVERMKLEEQRKRLEQVSRVQWLGRIS
jgi:hypothetical protein